MAPPHAKQVGGFHRPSAAQGTASYVRILQGGCHRLGKQVEFKCQHQVSDEERMLPCSESLPD